MIDEPKRSQEVLMKTLMLGMFAVAISVSAFAKDTYVKGYVKKDGTYVQPHYRTSPDSNPYNNYSTKGNTNPYTGKEGTKDPYSYGSDSSTLNNDD